MTEHVVIVAGPMGAGKTTAIRAVSDIEVVSTEALNDEQDLVAKATTTVALDYGEIRVGEEERIRLYGIPGQSRFDFMWTILAERARGLVVLVGADARDPAGDLERYLDAFLAVVDRGALVVGMTRTDVGGPGAADVVREVLARRLPAAPVPVFTVDARSTADVRVMLYALTALIDARTMREAATGAPAVSGAPAAPTATTRSAVAQSVSAPSGSVPSAAVPGALR